jgi:4-hydroxy-3-polyprenylbenzoate decarboxylase
MRLVVALTGASGQIYGIRMLEVLSETDVEVHLVMSPAAEKNIEIETDYGVEDVKMLADYVYDYADVGAAIASGSFKHDGMAIVPCSIKTASSIAYSIASNLIVRAADVTLKEKRRLVLAVRETPLHLGHLSTLTRLAELGAVIFPPVPAFYSRPKSIDDIVNHTVGRILDFFDVEHELYTPWGEEKRERTSESFSRM